MFDQLTSRLTETFKQLRGLNVLTEANIEPTLKDIRFALLEADVALPVVKTLLQLLKDRLIGQAVDAHLSPAQTFLKHVQETLTEIMGESSSELMFNAQPPAVFLMAGLQGSGKTTTTAKLAHYLKTKENKKVMMVSTDIYRPAAIEQLKILAEKLEVPFVDVAPGEQPTEIAKKALEQAKRLYVDVLLVDTAGRLHIDEDMMHEIQQLHQTLQPIETLFVVDSMTGQDAAKTAQAFHETLPLTGVVLTKTDGDARGGAALSVKMLTGKPIKLMGTGEKIEALERFYPERMASRILGMGDMLSLIEELEEKADKKIQEKLNNKLRRGQGFDLEDFRTQLMQMNQMGGIGAMMKKLPGAAALGAQAMPSQMSEKMMKKTMAILDSMTMQERRQPKLILGSRKKRIALGSGTQLQDVNRLLKQFEQMQKMMQKFMKPGAMKNMMRGLGALKQHPGLSGLLPKFQKDK
jgi:signal recognition particle subunit SRP54